LKAGTSPRHGSAARGRQPSAGRLDWQQHARSCGPAARSEGLLRFPALRTASRARRRSTSKPPSQFGPGPYELREHFEGNAYRMMYAVSHKKGSMCCTPSWRNLRPGSACLPKRDAELIAVRLLRARELDSEQAPHG